MGGGLIAASFLVAVLLNRSAHEEAPPAQAAPEPPARVCEDSTRPRPPGPRPDVRTSPPKTASDLGRIAEAVTGLPLYASL